MRPTTRLRAFAIAISIMAGPAARAADRDVDVPIIQSRIRDGNIRYGVWVTVGERTVEAMLDTGSTGLRVLPNVLPGNLVGVRTEAAFGSGADVRGIAVRVPITIGSLTGMATVEVVEDSVCVKDKPNCDATRLAGDGFRFGGDGFSSEGYSAILGIGLPFRGSDIGNPLTALGVKRWIVDLPRPYAASDGHLILDPDPTRQDGFAILDRHGFADGDGCIQGASIPEPTCGAVLFDTGAPAVLIALPDVKAASAWADGTTATFTFKSGDRTLNLDFKAGETGGLRSVVVAPTEPQDPAGPFIMAGIAPYFAYDILYDGQTHAVALKKRPSEPDEGISSGSRSTHGRRLARQARQ